MKKYIIMSFVIFSSFITFSQTSLENSKWKIHTEIPRSSDLQYEFKKDTLVVFNDSGIETQRMLFSQQHDTLYLKMLSGTSPCPMGTEGWYTVVWQENKQTFSLKVIKDGCVPRINRLTRMQVLQKIN
jgi:hypothetical protein